MTNPSPQEPQNSIPERRKRAAAGVTFDEMIGIIVAFSTIGAILFWSLRDKQSTFANNFDWAKNPNVLVADEDEIDSVANSDASVKFKGSDAQEEKLAIVNNSSEPNRPVVVAPGDSGFGTTGEVAPKSYRLETAKKIAPITGVAVIPELTRPNTQNPQDLDVDSGKVDPPEIPEPSLDSTKEQPSGIAPDKAPDPTSTPSTPQDPAATTEMPNDVEPSYWAYPFVKQMSEQALVPDFADDSNFEPDKLITRASMATLISQAFPDQPKTQSIKQFKDVTNNNAIAADIDQAVRIGFMQGYSDQEFRPLENIPRYQVLVTLASGLGLKPSQNAEQVLQKFSDGTNIPDWSKQQVAAAIEAGLAVNRPDFAQDALNPDESATRAEVAAMIHQALVKTGKLKAIDSEYLLNP